MRDKNKRRLSIINKKKEKKKKKKEMGTEKIKQTPV